jgi:hypothetical protein
MKALTMEEAGQNLDNIIHKTKAEMSQTDKRDLVQWLLRHVCFIATRKIRFFDFISVWSILVGLLELTTLI